MAKDVAKKDENTNTLMWDRLMPTNPKYTKPFKGAGGFSGTAINGMYVIQRLTEEFGPCGIGWRFVIDEEEIIQGHTLKNGDRAWLHKIRGHIQYRVVRPTNTIDVDAPWFSTSPQFGQTMLVGENKYGTYTDEEAAKKSTTDCLGKCAAMLGIGADIFLGLFDDNKYVNQRKQEEAEEAAPQPDEHHRPPEAVANKAAIAAQADAANTTDDMTIAKQVFYLVRDTARKATDLNDLELCLKHNKAALDVLKRVAAANADSLRAIVAEERRRLSPPVDKDLNDDVPDFT